MKTALRVTEATMLEALRRRFAPPEWAFLPHVRDATGGRATRTADAIAMNLWPSRGLAVHGFEVKVDRRDWLREMKAPDKAEVMAAKCDAWWLAVPAGIVVDDEVPESWGLLILDEGAKLRAAREPTYRPPGERGPIPRTFLAAILRRANETDPNEQALREAYERGKHDAEKDAVAGAARAAGWDRDGYVKLQERVSAFEEASGIRITAWAAGKDLGDAVRALVHDRHLVENTLRRMDGVAGELAQLAKQVAEARERAANGDSAP